MKKKSCKPKLTKHAYGSKIQTKWERGDYATVGLDAGSGAITGATIGSVVPVVGTAIGAVVGGLVGLGKGILGSSAKAKQRAQLKEANRQQTMQNMESRMTADSANTNYTNTSPSFYLRGGRIHMMGSSIPGMKPIASDSELAIGPSHENGGIPYGPNDEIEGGETTMQKPTETLVFSDRLKVPGTNKTFAKLSYPLMIEKGKIEKEFESILKSSEKEVEVLNDPTNSKVKRNSSIRRGEINTLRSSEKLAKINAINIVLEDLFRVQEQVNGNEQESEDGSTQHGTGGSIKKYREEYLARVRGGRGVNMLPKVPVVGKKSTKFEGNVVSPMIDYTDLTNTNPFEYKPTQKPKNGIMMEGIDQSPKSFEIYEGVKINPAIKPSIVAKTNGAVKAAITSSVSNTTIPFDTNAFVTDDFKSKVSAIPTLPARVSQPGTLVDTSNLQEMSPKLIGSGDASGFKVNGTALQYAADALDTISQAISSYQMSKLPMPNRAMMPRMRFNTHVDNSKDINDINSTQASIKKFIADNVRNPQVRRAMMIDLATKMNAARSTSFLNKFNMEQSLENKNTELAFQTIAQNNGASFQNAVDKFNQTTATYTRNSQIAANFADKIGQVGLNKEREDSQYVSLGLMLSQYPESVRKNILANLKSGKSLKQSIVG